MISDADLVAAIEVAVRDAWFAACEQPELRGSCGAHQLATFHAMAESAVRSARAGQRDEAAIARALCFGFWRDHPAPRAWERHGVQQREMFITVARAVLAAGAAMRSARAA